jgi:lipoprotein-anchoring transpeptidase ErfK/SrfK
MKKSYIIKYMLFILPLLTVTDIQANIQTQRSELKRLDRELYVVHEQNRMLKERLLAEKEKMFNNGRVSAYEKMIETYQAKEVSLKQEKAKLLQIKTEEERRVRALERQIPLMTGDIIVKIDLSDQIMNVYKGDTLIYSWFVSTARNGYITPSGHYKPYHREKMHFSKLYDDAPMPYSVFFKDGYAIHGTEYVRSLGYIASHGCVRLETTNAQKLYDIIGQHGYNRTYISIGA